MNHVARKPRDLFRGRGPFVLLCCLLLLLCRGKEAGAQGYDLSEKISLSMNGVNAAEVLQAIDKQTNFSFTYSVSDLSRISVSSIRFRELSLRQALQHLKDAYHLDYSVIHTSISFRLLPAKPSGEEKKKGTLQGKVMDAVSGEAVIGGTVKAGEQGTITDIDGAFRMELPEGEYDLLLSSIGYQAKKVQHVVVTGGQLTLLDLTLSSASGSLQEVVVTSTAKNESVASLYLKQKANAAISDGISAEQIARTPDNNVAQVLSRISGLSLQDNKFVTVRGMSDRYNNVTLDGSILPSTEPSIRNFSFDMIPSSLVDNIVVNKSPTPDMPADFAGGLVQVTTKDIPETDLLQLSYGTGVHTLSMGKTFLMLERSDPMYLGAMPSDRKWLSSRSIGFRQDAYQDAYANYQNDSSLFPLLRREASRIKNTWGQKKYAYTPMQNGQLVVGKTFRLAKERRMGVELLGTYRHEETVTPFFQSRPTWYDYNGAKYDFTTTWALLAKVAYQTRKDKLVFSYLNNRRLNIKHISYTGTDYDRSRNAHDYLEYPLVTGMQQFKLNGEHKPGGKGIVFSWSGDYIKMDRDYEDARFALGNRQTIRSATGDSLEYIDFYSGETKMVNPGGAIYASTYNENRYNAKGDLSIPFKALGRTQKLKAGYWFTHRDAEFNEAAFKVVGVEKDYALYSERALWDVPSNPGVLYAPTGPTVGVNSRQRYDGQQDIHAAYLMGDFQLLPRLRLVGGVRMENSWMRTGQRFFLLDTSGSIVNNTTPLEFREQYFLPSGSLIYSLTPKMNLRASYGENITRPDFRERSGFIYYDISTKEEIKGGGLKDVHIYSADVRYEFYPSASEIFSVSLFYKRFNDPIEMVCHPSSFNSDFNLYYVNLLNAINKGFEVDFRKNFSFIGPGGFWKHLYANGNLSWMDASVEYDFFYLVGKAQGFKPEQLVRSGVNRKRPLQGLAPYVINAGLGYFTDRAGINVTYNRTGRRIKVGGAEIYADQYENERDIIDVQLSCRLLKKKLEAKLNISDLLHQDYIVYMNTSQPEPGKLYSEDNHDPKGFGYNPDLDDTRYREQRGTGISLSLSYRF